MLFAPMPFMFISEDSSEKILVQEIQTSETCCIVPLFCALNRSCEYFGVELTGGFVVPEQGRTSIEVLDASIRFGEHCFDRDGMAADLPD